MFVRARRSLLCIALALLAFGAGTITAAPSALAFGQETYGCRVSPGTDLVWRGVCQNNVGATQYNAGFALLNTSGTYATSWTISGPYSSIFVGCGSGDLGCGVWVPNSDASVTVSVTYSQNGQTATRSATAVIRQFCGSQPC